MQLPKVLFINNIRKANLLANTEVHVAPSEIKTKITYANVPSRVVQVSDIGLTAKYRCWYCDLEYEGVAIFNPKVIEAGRITAEGNFNSIKCLLSYISAHYHDSPDEIEARNKAHFLYKLMLEKKMIPRHSFEPAPSKYLMRQYGGPLSEQDYLQALDT